MGKNLLDKDFDDFIKSKIISYEWQTYCRKLIIFVKKINFSIFRNDFDAIKSISLQIIGNYDTN